MTRCSRHWYIKMLFNSYPESYYNISQANKHKSPPAGVQRDIRTGLFLFWSHLNNSDNIFCGTSYFLVNENLLGVPERVQHNVIIIYVILSRWRYTEESFILFNMFAKSILLFFCRSAAASITQRAAALCLSSLLRLRFPDVLYIKPCTLKNQASCI